MARDNDSAVGRAPAAHSPVVVDRILIGACTAIWLVLLGVSVAATVALVDLGRGHPNSTAGSHTPWLLYTVMGVSGLIILGAVPLLVRARRSALADPHPGGRAAGSPAPTGQPEPPTERLRAYPDPFDRDPPGYPGPLPSWRARGVISASALDRMWLRCTVLIVGAMGAALVAVATATYLMAVDMDSSAWVAYGLAGVLTLAMPVIPWQYLRQLHSTLTGGGEPAA